MSGHAPKPALILSNARKTAGRIAKRTPTERWHITLQSQNFQPQSADPTNLAVSFQEQNQVFALALGEWVIDTICLEEITEYYDDCQANEVLTFSAPNIGLAPLVFMGNRAAVRTSTQNCWTLDAGIDRFVQGIKEIDGVKVRQVNLAAGYWSEVLDTSSAKIATWKLLKQLQWRPGGVVAKYLNRPISIRISRLLLNTSLTPNQTTIFAFLLGAIGIALIFMGSYEYIVLGGILLQLNSVIDGIDGELARIRLTTSEFGAYLDSVCDEILNAALFAGMGYTLAQTTGWSPYFYIGIFTGSVAFLYSLIHWHCKWKHGLGFYWWFEAYKPRKQVQRSNSVLSYFKKLFWKESYFFLFMLAAIFDVYFVLLWVAVPATVAVLFLFFIHIVIKRARW